MNYTLNKDYALCTMNYELYCCLSVQKSTSHFFALYSFGVIPFSREKNLLKEAESAK